MKTFKSLVLQLGACNLPTSGYHHLSRLVPVVLPLLLLIILLSFPPFFIMVSLHSSSCSVAINSYESNVFCSLLGRAQRLFQKHWLRSIPQTYLLHQERIRPIYGPLPQERIYLVAVRMVRIGRLSAWYFWLALITVVSSWRVERTTPIGLVLQCSSNIRWVSD